MGPAETDRSNTKGLIHQANISNTTNNKLRRISTTVGYTHQSMLNYNMHNLERKEVIAIKICSA